MASESGLLDAAETIAALLEKQGTATVVIGAAALDTGSGASSR